MVYVIGAVDPELIPSHYRGAFHVLTAVMKKASEHRRKLLEKSDEHLKALKKPKT